MTLQDLFELVDRLFGLTYVPTLQVALCYLPVLFLLFLLFFKLMESSSTTHRDQDFDGENPHRKWFFPVTFLSCLALLMYGLFVLLSFARRTSPTSYLVSSALAILTLMFSISLGKGKEKYLLLLVLIFSLTGEALRMNLLNGVFLHETTLDTVNIFVSGRWKISYHNPVYDVMPYDSVLGNILLSIFGIRDPTNIVPKIILDEAISVVMVLSSFLFATYLNLPKRVGLLSAVMMLSLPYLQITITPTNFAFMFAALFIALQAKCLTTRFTPSQMLCMIVLFTCGILSYQQSFFIVVPIAALFFMLMLRSGKRGKKISRILGWLIILGIVIFLAKLIHTRSLETTYVFFARYLRSALEGMTSIPGTRGKFRFAPISTKIMYMLPLAISGSFMGKVLIDLVRSKRVLLHKSRIPNLFLSSIFVGEFILGIFSGLPLMGREPTSRYFGQMFLLCLGFGMTPILNLLFHRRVKMCSEIARKILLAVMFVTVLTGFLTPHKMPDQYFFTLSLRGGVFEDYITSETLVEHIPFYSSGEFLVLQKPTDIVTRHTLRPGIYVSYIKHLLLTDVPLHEDITTPRFRLYHEEGIKEETMDSLMSQHLFYNSGIYNIFFQKYALAGE